MLLARFRADIDGETARVPVTKLRRLAIALHIARLTHTTRIALASPAIDIGLLTVLNRVIAGRRGLALIVFAEAARAVLGGVAEITAIAGAPADRNAPATSVAAHKACLTFAVANAAIADRLRMIFARHTDLATAATIDLIGRQVDAPVTADNLVAGALNTGHITNIVALNINHVARAVLDMTRHIFGLRPAIPIDTDAPAGTLSLAIASDIPDRALEAAPGGQQNKTPCNGT